MFRSSLRWALAIGLLSSLASAWADEAGRFEYQEKTLPNGMRIVTMEDFSCPVVAVQLWYHVGSKDEHPERQGFAHMFEHMMFRGTDRLGPTDHFDNIRRVGGDCNAYTSMDQTVYVQTLPADQLEMALWLEAERMSFLKIDQEAFDTERKVVEEERRLGLNRPYGTLFEKVLGSLFEKHPYRWSTIGQIPHLRAASVPELRQFWTTYYVPNNATLVVVGAVKHEQVQEMAERMFGWIPRYDDPPRVRIEEPLPGAPKEITIKEDNAPAPLVGVLYRTVPMKHEDSVALSMLGDILAGGESSRIYRDLVKDRGLAAMAAGGSFSMEQDGLLGVGAVLPPMGGDADAVLAAIDEHVARARNELVTPEELEKARNGMLRSMVTQKLTVESKAGALGSAAVLEGDAARVNHPLEALRRITAEDLQRVAQQYLTPERLYRGKVERNLMGTLGGMLGFAKNEEEAPVTAAPETDPPPPGRPGLVRPEGYPTAPPSAPLQRPDATIRYDSEKLPNGLEVLVVENHELPFVSVQLGLRNGAWTESKTGVANMAMQMLTRGTENYSEADLWTELDTYAISLNGSADMDNATVFGSCLTEHTDRAMKLLAEVVLRPTFPEKEFETLRRQALTGLAISSKEPSYIAERELRRRLYGDHPYSRTPLGEYGDVEALEPADLSAWWKAFGRPDGATLIFSGDIDKAAAVELAKRHLGDWKNEGEAPRPQLADMPPAGPTQIFLVDFPGVQSQIRVGQRSGTRKDPGYFTSRVVGGYFGGAFNSHLNETIRVERGLTYGARGGWSAQRLAGQFVVSTFSKTESTAAALTAIFEELARLRDEPPTPKELTDTVSYIVGSFAGDRETPQSVAGDLWLTRSQDLGDDYLTRMLETVSHTSADECTKFVAEAVDPAKLVVVVVGPAQTLAESLKQFGPVTVVSNGDGEDEIEDE